MSTSSDGGLTWGAATATANRSTGIGGQPLVQPNGTVVVPIETSGISAFTSTNGGAKLVGAGYRRQHSKPHRCRRNSQRPAAFGGGGCRRHGLGGVGGLPLPRQLLDQRSRLQHLQRWRYTGPR